MFARFDEDGSPKSLKAFLDSTGGGLTFSFRLLSSPFYGPPMFLLGQMERLSTNPWKMIVTDVFWAPVQRCSFVKGHSCRFASFPQYVMIDGKFDLPDDRPGGQMVEGKYTLAPLYHVKVGLSARVLRL